MASSSGATTYAGFLDLPLELRQEIYALAVVDKSQTLPLDHTRYSHSPSARRNGCFCNTPSKYKVLRLLNRQTHGEVQDTFFGNNSFSLTMPNLSTQMRTHKSPRGPGGCECDFALSQIRNLTLKWEKNSLWSSVEIEMTRKAVDDSSLEFTAESHMVVWGGLKDPEGVKKMVGRIVREVLSRHLGERKIGVFTYSMVERLRLVLRKEVEELQEREFGRV
ncbi:hypothetical protein HII31_00446 [Pseudocercospora fuligena]|uniref:F-box domain-containing protein n=1 Tax=Pseudocercospora fuligena TaxID=685502 RepID=A0A8H6RUG5_9PEZI|nr:hypothetical protein HII31_00446 [Pseudocercospora fuligena]